MSETPAYARLARHHERLTELPPGTLIPVQWVVDEVVTPSMAALRASGRWLSLEQAVAQSGRSVGWYRNARQEYGGRSRLQMWHEEGVAYQQRAGSTWWIAPHVVPKRKPVRISPADRSGLSAAEIVAHLKS